MLGPEFQLPISVIMRRTASETVKAQIDELDCHFEMHRHGLRTNRDVRNPVVLKDIADFWFVADREVDA
jgi:hypothetical protein